MSSAWRTRCPRGHAALVGRNGDYYRCQACDHRYRGSPIDAKDHEFPLDDVEDRMMPDTATKLGVLAELVKRVDDDQWGLRANEIQAGPLRSASRRLGQLHDEGLVEKHDEMRRTRWKPTDAGRRLGGTNGGEE